MFYFGILFFVGARGGGGNVISRSQRFSVIEEMLICDIKISELRMCYCMSCRHFQCETQNNNM